MKPVPEPTSERDGSKEEMEEGKESVVEYLHHDINNSFPDGGRCFEGGGRRGRKGGGDNVEEEGREETKIK